jgi:hypothetical protein
MPYVGERMTGAVLRASVHLITAVKKKHGKLRKPMFTFML